MKPNDVRGTPWALYHELTDRFGECDVDVCTTLTLAKCANAYTLQGFYQLSTIADLANLSAEDFAAGAVEGVCDKKGRVCDTRVWVRSAEPCGLTGPWHGRAWCNPPFSEIGKWVEKAWAEMTCKARNCDSVLMIIPSGKVEQGWWQKWIEPFRDGKAGLNLTSGVTLTTHNLPKRRAFWDPEGKPIMSKKDPTRVGSPEFGVTVLKWGRE